jgi:uncharacterized protein
MSLSEKLKEIIADFYDKELPTVTTRTLQYEIVPHKIMTVTGVRRAGKTYFLYQAMQALMEEGASKQSILYMNFEDDRLSDITVKELPRILDCYFERYPEQKKERTYIFFDEIQNVDGWEKFIRRLQDSEDAQIFLTGSSAKLLSHEIATALRGRCLNYEVFPFSFKEFLQHQDVALKKSSASKAEIKNAFNDYIAYGGYPETIGYSERIWRNTLQDYIRLILYRDMIERHRIKNHSLVKYFIRHLLQNVASPLSINKLFNDMKSQGFSVSKDTLHLYLSYIEDAYTFFTVPIFSHSLRVQQVNYRKLYCVDIGLSEASVFGVAERVGALLENLVYLELRRDDQNEIYYHKTASGKEIDFFVIRNKQERHLIQVALHLEDPATRTRELDALCEAMDELDVSSSLIITRDAEEHFLAHEKIIKLMPFWKWALQEGVTR